MKSQIKSSPPFILPDWAKEPEDGLPQAPPPFIVPDWAKMEPVESTTETPDNQPEEQETERPDLEEQTPDETSRCFVIDDNGAKTRIF